MKAVQIALVLGAVLAILLAGSASAAPSAQSGQCPDATTTGNTATDDGSIVLGAGLTVCIHAGNGNTGTFVTDGTSTLADYIEASGLLNNGGQIPNVSNYVVYSMAPTPDVTPAPSETPAPTPNVTPTPVPSETTPAETAMPVVARPTLPPTDTIAPASASTSTSLLLAAVALFLLAAAAVSVNLGRRR